MTRRSQSSTLHKRSPALVRAPNDSTPSTFPRCNQHGRSEMRSLWRVPLLLLFLPALALAQPSIVSVIPNSADRGTNVGVQITGSETIFQQDTEVTSIVWLQQGATR